MAVTTEAAEMAEAAKMAEKAQMAMEWAAIVDAEAVRTATGAAVSKIKVTGIPNPAIIPLASTAISV